jgi:CBS domain-containing protein
MMTRTQDLLAGRRGRLFEIAPQASVADAARAFVEHGVSSLLVVEGGKLLGLITKNDLTRCCAEQPTSLQRAAVSDYMQTELYTTTPDVDLDELVRTMVQRGFHHVPVLEGETPVGMVTHGDILASECSRLHGEENELLAYIQGIY